MVGKLKLFFVLLTVLFFSFLFYSCHEKGCTDKSALNYNSVADVDDGSCIVCKVVHETIGSSRVDLYDNNFAGPHYGAIVATFFVDQTRDKFTYEECGVNTCHFFLKIQSYVSEAMDFTYHLQASGNVNFYWTNTVTVPGNPTMNVDSVPSDLISNPCDFLSSSSLFVSTNAYITYH